MRTVLYYILIVPLVGLLILSTYVYGQLRRVVNGTPDENNALLSAPGCRYRSIFCRGTRKSLLSFNSGIFLWTYYQALLGKTKLGRFGFRGKIRHLTTCKSCRDWVTIMIPKTTLDRQRRLADYCCSGLFCAVEEFEVQNGERVVFTMWRGEDPMWQIGGKHTPISFCPWCGTRMPNEPY